MIPSFVSMRIVRIVASQSAEVLFTESQLVHLVFQNDTSMEQGLLNLFVADGLLFFGEGNLCQIILTLMGIGSDGIRR